MFPLRFRGLAAPVVLAALTLLGASPSAETQLVTPVRSVPSTRGSSARGRGSQAAPPRGRVRGPRGRVQGHRRSPAAEAAGSPGDDDRARLDAIRFVDATESEHCRSSNTYAFAVRDSIVVYVCPRTMAKAQLRQPARVQTVVIHELLHTIGLGENPPTSSYITARVEARCL